MPHQGRYGRRPHPGAQPARQVSAAPRAAVAGQVDPDPRLPGVAAYPSGFDQPAMTQTFHHYLAVVEVPRTPSWTLSRPTFAGWCDRPPFDWQVARLAAYRGITRARRAHVGRRGRRLAPVRPRQPVHGVLRAGAKRVLPRQHGSTGAGSPRRATPPARPASRVGLVLSAPAGVGVRDRPPPAGPAPLRSWPGRGRRGSACARRFRALAAGKHTKSIVAAAIAREFAGFLWAEMTAA